MEAKTKWDGSLNQSVEFIDEWIGYWDSMTWVPMAFPTDFHFDQKDVNKLAETAKKLNKIVKYCIESGRLSKEKAQVILGEGTDMQEITDIENGKPKEIIVYESIGIGIINPSPLLVIGELNMITLEKKWIDKLSELPETGMGYQHVTFLMNDGGIFNGLVFNCQYLQLKNGEEEKFDQQNISDITAVENGHKED